MISTLCRTGACSKKVQRLLGIHQSAFTVDRIDLQNAGHELTMSCLLQIIFFREHVYRLGRTDRLDRSVTVFRTIWEAMAEDISPHEMQLLHSFEIIRETISSLSEGMKWNEFLGNLARHWWDHDVYIRVPYKTFCFFAKCYIPDRVAELGDWQSNILGLIERDLMVQDDHLWELDHDCIHSKLIVYENIINSLSSCCINGGMSIIIPNELPFLIGDYDRSYNRS